MALCWGMPRISSARLRLKEPWSRHRAVAQPLAGASGFLSPQMGRRIRQPTLEVSPQSRPQEALAPFKKETLGLSRTTNIDSTLSVVGRALLPVDESDGQECPSYEITALE